MGKKCIVADPEEEATEEQYSEDEDEVDEGGMGEEEDVEGEDGAAALQEPPPIPFYQNVPSYKKRYFYFYSYFMQSISS